MSLVMEHANCAVTPLIIASLVIPPQYAPNATPAISYTPMKSELPCASIPAFALLLTAYSAQPLTAAFALHVLPLIRNRLMVRPVL
jgi:hypothetical protein